MKVYCVITRRIEGLDGDHMRILKIFLDYRTAVEWVEKRKVRPYYQRDRSCYESGQAVKRARDGCPSMGWVWVRKFRDHGWNREFWIEEYDVDAREGGNDEEDTECLQARLRRESLGQG